MFKVKPINQLLHYKLLQLYYHTRIKILQNHEKKPLLTNDNILFNKNDDTKCHLMKGNDLSYDVA